MSTATSKSNKLAVTQKTFGDHIGELRSRLMWVAIVFLVTSGAAYYFRDILIDIILRPLGDQQLMYLTPAGGFAFIFQITMYAGAVLTAPVLIYNLYKFVQPALPARATRYSVRVFLVSTLLMTAGVLFGYLVAVPAALIFLTTFAGDFVVASLTADSYLNFVMAYVVGLGILFQLPLLLVFWNWISPLGPGKLLNSQRFIVLFAFIAAAMITPTPDVLNQALVAGPIIAIYQLGVVAVFIMNKRSRRADKKKRVVNQKPALKSLDELIAPDTQSAPVIKTSAPVVSTVKPSGQRSIDGIRPSRPAARPVGRRAAPPNRPLPQLKRPITSALSLDGVSRL